MYGEIQYDPALKLVVLSFQGVLTEHSFEDAMLASAAFLRTHEAAMAIVDTTAVTSIEISAQYLRAWVARNPILLPGRPRAVVAPMDAMFGLARLFYAHRDPESPVVYVLRSMPEALAALQIGTPALETVSILPLARESVAKAS
jgi:hypothetical protein